jgi:hypothetical protein
MALASKFQDIGLCWDIADKNILQYKTSLDRALRGVGKANPEICRDMIDKWLEYRHDHGASDRAAL